MKFIGIDPGQSGGIAVLSATGVVEFVTKMPKTDAEIDAVFSRFGGVVACEAVIEHVWSSPQMGVASAFKFGRGYGALCMALAGNRIPFKEVTPQVWQKYMNCRTGGDKSITKELAQQLFPTLKVTHAIADSLLIAEYARRVSTF